MSYDPAGDLKVARELKAFVDQEALPGTGLDGSGFWESLSAIVAAFAPRDAALLAKRDAIQGRLDEWHVAHRGQDDRSRRIPHVPEGDRLPAPAPAAFSVDTRTSTPRSPASPGRSSSCRSTTPATR